MFKHQGTREKVCVLAAWPILTITVEKPENHDDQIYLHAGGQGFWVARMIANLGDEPILCGPLGGEVGVVIEALARAEGVKFASVKTDKWNGAYIHDRRGGERRTFAETKSPALNRHEYDDLYDLALTTALDAGVMALTGAKDKEILPLDFYARLARDLGANGVKIVADLAAEPLRTLEEGVSILKISDEEAVEAGFSESRDRGSIVSALPKLKSTGAQVIIVSRADEPAVALVDSRILEITPPRLHPLDHRGAGDSMTAALCHALAHGLDIESTLRLAAAAGALNVTRHGLGTGRLEDIESLARAVEIAPLKA